MSPKVKSKRFALIASIKVAVTIIALILAVATCMGMMSCTARFDSFNDHRKPANVYDELLNAAMDAGCQQAYQWQERWKSFGRKFYGLEDVVNNPNKSDIAVLLVTAPFLTRYSDEPSQYELQDWGAATWFMSLRYSPSDTTSHSKYSSCVIEVKPLSIDDLYMSIKINPNNKSYTTLVYHRIGAVIEADDHGYDNERFQPVDEALDCLESMLLADYFAYVGDRSSFDVSNLGVYSVVEAVIDKDSISTYLEHLDVQQ